MLSANATRDLPYRLSYLYNMLLLSTPVNSSRAIRQGFANIAWLSEDWPPAAAQEGEQERAAARRSTLLLSFGGWGAH
jgi:hypothetical protein